MTHIAVPPLPGEYVRRAPSGGEESDDPDYEPSGTEGDSTGGDGSAEASEGNSDSELEHSEQEGDVIYISRQRALEQVAMARRRNAYPPPTSGPEEGERSCHQCRHVNAHPKMGCPGLRLARGGYPCELVYCEPCVDLRCVRARSQRANIH